MKGRRGGAGLHNVGHHLDTRFYSCHKPSGENRVLGRGADEDSSKERIGGFKGERSTYHDSIRNSFLWKDS